MILITGGGTGGHLAIARSLKEAFLTLGSPVVYVGSTKGQDRAWFEHDSQWEGRYFLPSEGVVDKKGVRKITALTKIARQIQNARNIIRRHRVKAVVSVGGYSAAPASFAAIIERTPLFIHEQNAVIGRLNTLLKPLAKRFFSSFHPPYDPYPVDPRFYTSRRIRKELRTVIFLGGSQGAREINDLALSLAPKLHARGVAIIHQCGSKDFVRIKKEYEKQAIDVDLFDFDPEIVQKIARADLAIARAGASTLWELTANALPALYLPYPYAAGDHQRKNALFIEQKGGAKLWRGETDLDRLDLRAMSEKLIELFEPDGAQKIARQIMKAI